MIRFSVIMPTYNQEEFIRRAILSLYRQTHTAWELIIINDGSTDNTEECLQDILMDNRIRYIKNEENKGLGYALNQGLDAAQYDYIAYLPSDDYYMSEHLEILAERLEESEDIVLAYSIAQCENEDSTELNFVHTTTNSLFRNLWLQLVQTAHRKTPDRWIERSEFVTEDLFKMFWYKLTDKGVFSSIRKVTANWTSHPFQRHKHICERYGGGINIYRQYYNVKEPIKLKMSEYHFINEEELYKKFRVKHEPKADGLKILIVGDLAFNSERICALEEEGHKLYGIWTQRPTMSFSMVGPLPYGNIEDIPFNNWERKVRQIKPDIIYALLNQEAINTVYQILKKNPGIPFVWHFKEGPFMALMMGQWKKLFELFNLADGRIFINQESKEWFEQFLYNKKPSLIIDGDLPKKDYFTDDFSPLLSEHDGEIHTVIPGRIVGVTLDDVKVLAANKIHLHIYIENYFERKVGFNISAMKVAPNHFHIHPPCVAPDWVKEFSQYDAGWLHCFKSKNKGVLMNAGWNDLNMPARMNTLAAAGLPMIQMDNTGHIVGMQSRVKKDDLGLFFNTYEELAEMLHDKERMKRIRSNVREHRFSFSFDYYLPELISLFYLVIQSKKQ